MGADEVGRPEAAGEPDLRGQLALALGRERLARAGGLLGLLVIAAAAEALAIAALFPFLRVLTALGDPGTAATDLVPEQLSVWLGAREPRELVGPFAAGLLAFFVVKNAGLVALTHVTYRFTHRAHYDLSLRLFRAYMGAPWRVHLRRNSSELLRGVLLQARHTVSGVLLPAVHVAKEGLVVAAFVGLLLAVQPLVTLGSLVFFGASAAAFLAFTRRKNRRLGREQLGHYDEVLRALQQGLGGLKEARIVRREDYFVRRFAAANDAFTSVLRYQATIKELPRYFLETLAMVTLLGTALALTAIESSRASAVVPLLGLYGLTAVRLVPAVNRIVANLTRLQHHRPALEAVCRDLEELEPPGGGARADRRAAPGSVEAEAPVMLSGVEFAHDGAAEPVVHGLDLELPAGQATAIVGPSGAGKTTLLDLLLGLHRPRVGSVRLGATDVHEALAWWQAQLGYVPQDVFLLDESIRSNVAFGRPEEEVDEERVWRALEQARLAEFVRGLPEELATTVGEGGARISGGQRQRLGIARALYGAPRILVLDEATSALDRETEREIVRELLELRPEITIVLVTHRLQAARDCDRVALLAEGRIAAAGPYEELLARSPAFRRLAVEDGEPGEPALGRTERVEADSP